VRRDTQGAYRDGSGGGSITPMDATIHTLIAAHLIQQRIDEATGARQARSVRRRRLWSRKVRETVVADQGRQVVPPPPTVTVH
jgi:hypothetical protein